MKFACPSCPASLRDSDIHSDRPPAPLPTDATMVPTEAVAMIAIQETLATPRPVEAALVLFLVGWHRWN